MFANNLPQSDRVVQRVMRNLNEDLRVMLLVYRIRADGHDREPENLGKFSTAQQDVHSHQYSITIDHSL